MARGFPGHGFPVSNSRPFSKPSVVNDAKARHKVPTLQRVSPQFQARKLVARGREKAKKSKKEQKAGIARLFQMDLKATPRDEAIFRRKEFEAKRKAAQRPRLF